MSFSHPDFAAFVQARFEPAWESVRDVPRVTIDFGGETIVRRTLHGNVATYVCLPDGSVVDVVPGLYDRVTFRERLAAAADLAVTVAALPAEARVAAVRKHHTDALRRLAATRLRTAADAGKRVIELPVEGVVVTAPPVRGASKSGIEDPVEETVSGNEPPVVRVLRTKDRIERPVERGLRRTPDLTRDTANNDANRRPAVHRLLADSAGAAVADLTKRIYRDVLGTDLDDPYLGLGETLFATYPFMR